MFFHQGHIFPFCNGKRGLLDRHIVNSPRLLQCEAFLFQFISWTNPTTKKIGSKIITQMMVQGKRAGVLARFFHLQDIWKNPKNALHLVSFSAIEMNDLKDCFQDLVPGSLLRSPAGAASDTYHPTERVPQSCFQSAELPGLGPLTWAHFPEAEILSVANWKIQGLEWSCKISSPGRSCLQGPP